MKLPHDVYGLKVGQTAHGFISWKKSNTSFIDEIRLIYVPVYAYI